MTAYLRDTCATCGGRIEITYPPTHVHSSHTGNHYCLDCAVNGHKPKKGRKKLMATAASTRAKPASKDKAAASNGPALIESATAALSAVDGVQLIEKKGYFRVVKDGATVGYLNGSRKLRMDFASGSSGYDQMTADDKPGVTAIVNKVKSFKAPVKAAKAPAKPKAKATGKAKAKPAAKKGKSAPGGPVGDVEVTPDPK